MLPRKGMLARSREGIRCCSVMERQRSEESPRMLLVREEEKESRQRSGDLV